MADDETFNDLFNALLARPLHYRRDGTPYPSGKEGLFEWAKDLENFELKRVARTKLRFNFIVSTIWLGLDHGFGVGPPRIFETMVFPPWSFGVYACHRYATEAQALEGHNQLVAEWSRPTRILRGILHELRWKIYSKWSMMLWKLKKKLKREKENP